MPSAICNELLVFFGDHTPAVQDFLVQTLVFSVYPYLGIFQVYYEDFEKIQILVCL